MQTLSEILDFLRAATSTEEYTQAINRLREVETDLGELRARMETAEEAAIFSGDDPASPRETIRQCDDNLRTIQVAIAGAERRMRQAEIAEDAVQVENLGRAVAVDAESLAGLYRDVRRHIEEARGAMFEAVRMAAALDMKNETLVSVGRHDLIRRTSQIRRDVMGEDLPRAPHHVPRSLRDADKVLVALGTGKRPWMSAAASLIGAPIETNMRVLDHPLQRAARA